MYVYRDFMKDGCYTVGHYSPAGEWVPESDHATIFEAAKRAAWLNGSRPTSPASTHEALNSGDGTYRP